jgi:hypothetical protein
MDNASILEIVLRARDEASKTIGQLGSSVDDLGKRSANLSESFKIAGGIITGVGFAGLGIMKTLSDAGATNEGIMAQTKATLKSTKGAAGETADQIERLADSYALLTPYSNDAIQTSENLLLTFTSIGKDIFPQATQTVMDVATAMHEDLQSASVQVGKALQDPATGMAQLHRIGVNFTAQQIDQAKHMMATGQTAKAQAIVMNELNKEFGGSAQAQGKTYAGQMKILSNEFDKLKETLGARLLPGMTDFTKSISKVVDSMNHLSPQTYDAIIAFLKIGTAMALIGGPLLLLIGFLPALTAGFTLISPILLPVIAVIAAFVAVAYLIYKNWQTVLNIFNATKPYIDDVVKAFSQFWTEIQPKLQAVWKEIQKGIGDITKYIQDHWTEIKLVTEIILGTIAALIIVIWDGIKMSIKIVLDAISGNWKGVWTDIKGFFIGIWDDLNALTGNKLDVMWKSITGWVAKIIQPFREMADGISKALHSITFPHLNIGTGSIKVMGKDIQYPNLDVKWYQNGGFVPDTGLAMLHQGEFVLSKAMLAGRQPSPMDNRSFSNNSSVTIQNVNIRNESDIDTLVKKLTLAMKYDSSY